MKKAIPFIFLVAALVVSGCIGQVPTTGAVVDINNSIVGPLDDSVHETDNSTNQSSDSIENSSFNNERVVIKEVTKTLVLTGENFKFLMGGVEAPELRVKEGDVVRIEFTSTDGFHDWVVDEFNAATAKVKTGESAFVDFVADKKGIFEYYCSVGSHRLNGMKGNLTVE